MFIEIMYYRYFEKYSNFWKFIWSYFFSTTYMYDIANWIYIITLVVDMMFAMLKNENYLKDIYIEIKNENKNVRTKEKLKKLEIW